MQLYASVHDPAFHFAGKQFCFRRIVCAQRAIIVRRNALIDKGLCNIDFRTHASHLETCILEICDRLAERFAILNIVQRDIERSRRRGDIADRTKKTLFSQEMHQVVEAAIQLT